MQPGTKFERKQVETFGYTIDYVEAGSGEDVIVFYPGSAGLEMSTAKDMLAERYRVVEIDPPGWGGSASLSGEMKQRDLGYILSAAVEAIGIGHHYLIGTSMGGTNALWSAYFHPDRIRGLILEGPMVFHTPDTLVRPEGGPPPQHLLRSGAISWDPSMYPSPHTHPKKPWGGGDFFHEQMRRRFKMFAYTTLDDGSPLPEFAKTMEVPVTLLLGTADEILKPNYADRFKEMVPSADVVMVEGGTHDIQNTDPEAFVAAVDAVAGS